MSIPFLRREKADVEPGGSAEERLEGAQKVPYRAACCEFERAVPSASVGKQS